MPGIGCGPEPVHEPGYVPEPGCRPEPEPIRKIIIYYY